MPPMKKKGTSGEANLYYDKHKAISKLQVPLPIFRRLCIYKGIYPREPKHRKRAQHGNEFIKELYLKSDIKFLSHEPLIHLLRARRVHSQKVNKYLARGEKSQSEYHRFYELPTLSFDHLVRERYPTFRKALQDLEDPLNTLFLYAVLPKSIGVTTPELVADARRLTCEFMYYIIESRSLRKTFISFKGYYYEARIKGIDIIWMVPHPFTPQAAEVRDMKVMHWFTEFYATMLGFVNFKLYQSLNIHYPPQLVSSQLQTEENASADIIDSSVEALSIPLLREYVEDDEKARLKKKSMAKQAYLFKDKKFFLGRETNRESLTLVIRSGGGLVSWDATSAHGATYDESDLSIEYQVVDRPEVDKKYLNRYYIQPQWVYDSFNEALLLPVNDYFPGVQLPAHLSPFKSNATKLDDTYLPPEKLKILEMKNQLKIHVPQNAIEHMSDEEISTDDEVDEDQLQKERQLFLSKLHEKSGSKVLSQMGVKEMDMDADNSEKSKKIAKLINEGNIYESQKASNQIPENVTKDQISEDKMLTKQIIKDEKGSKDEELSEDEIYARESEEESSDDEIPIMENGNETSIDENESNIKKDNQDIVKAQEASEMSIHPVEDVLVDQVSQKEKVKNTKKRKEKVKMEDPVDEGKGKEDPIKENVLAKLKVREGRAYIVNEDKLKKMEAREDFKLSEKFIHKKFRRLYHKIKRKEKSHFNEKIELRRRRILYETIKLGQKRWEKMQKKAQENPKKNTFDETESHYNQEKFKPHGQFQHQPVNLTAETQSKKGINAIE